MRGVAKEGGEGGVEGPRCGIGGGIMGGSGKRGSRGSTYWYRGDGEGSGKGGRRRGSN